MLLEVHHPAAAEGAVALAERLWASARALPSIVVPELGDQQVPAGNLINHAVLIVDPTGPITGECAFKRLGFAETLERVPPDILDQPIDP